MIASAQSIGISKRALMEEYYPDEIGIIFDEWNAMHGVERVEEKEVDVLEFLQG